MLRPRHSPSRSPSTGTRSPASLFWLNVGILAGTYAIFALGLQLNVGFTGIINFGQAGFMAIRAWTMAILVLDDLDFSFLARAPGRERWPRSASWG